MAAASWDRRQVLSGLGLGGLGFALTGCKTAPPQVVPKCIVPGPASWRRIDAHVHVFNGTDLQIAGFLSKCVAYEYDWAKGFLQLIAQPLQDFVWANSPLAKDERDHLDRIVWTERGLSVLASSVFLEQIARDQDKTAQQYSQFLGEQFRRDNVRQAAAEMAWEKSGRKTVRPPQFSDPGSPEKARKLAEGIDGKLGIPLFDYLGRYFNYRYANMYELAASFACDRIEPIDSFVSLMVDFDQPLGAGGETRSPIKDQCDVMSKIATLWEGRLLVLAPYCPLKDARQSGKSWANVHYAWGLPGFVGAKMYPPMGFMPHGNGQLADGKAVDAALEAFYGECVKCDAVVMAHAGSSLCVGGKPCEMPGPGGWGDALSWVHTNLKASLRAGLGHFGHPFGTTEDSSKWPGMFADLMKLPGGERLYADLSYASEILKGSNNQPYVTRLASLLHDHPVLAERLMYGTDWLMVTIESGWKNYEHRMKALADAVEKQAAVPGFSGRLFGGNARAWLGLDKPDSLAARNTAALLHQ